MEIRNAVIDDLDFLERLECESFPEHRRSSRKSLRHSLTSPYQNVYIAIEDGKPCGSITIMRHKHHIRVYSIAVSSEYMGKGIGSGLIDYAVSVAKDMGIGTMSLEVDMHNNNLVRWYENYGFETTQVIVDYYAKNEDALKMVLQFQKQEKSRNIVVTDYDTDFFDDIPGIIQIRANTYIEDEVYQSMKDIRVFNLCSSLSYQTVGYYVSLLALARNHSVYPNTTSLRDFKNNVIVKSIGDEIFEQIQVELEGVEGKTLSIDSYFGYCYTPKYQNLVKVLNLLYEAPLLRYYLVKKNYWELHKVTTIDLVDNDDSGIIKSYAIKYFSQKRFIRGSLNIYKYDMAILIDPLETKPPSDKIALNKFRLAAEALGFFVEFITKKDYKRIPEFDALFIRVTTNVNDYTYDFARYAYAEGLVVIDDPWSILRCSNKLYLYEALKAADVKMPKTWMISKKINYEETLKTMVYPLVLKQPDSAFSLGVYKVTDFKECKNRLKELLKKSEIIVAQEFLPSEYDWRIGIIDQKPIYACKYYMAKDHWQIYQWNNSNSGEVEGDSETMSIEDVPKKVIKAALKAANKIGDGFYGVDLKEIKGEVYIIEVNDNPSIEYGVEDAYLGDKLYTHIMKSFYKRLESDRETVRKISQ